MRRGSSSNAIAGLLVILLALCAEQSDAQVAHIYEALMLGSEVVPPTSSTGTGSMFSAFASADTCPGVVPEDSLQVCIGYFQLSGTPTGCQIRRGVPGENGPLFVTLHDSWFPWPCEDVSISVVLADCPDLRDGRMYVVILTDLYPNGEVRGQIHHRAPNPVAYATWGAIKSAYR